MNTEVYLCTIERTIKKEWGIYGVLFKNFNVDIHKHEYYEINIIYSGTGVHRIENESYQVKRGDVFMIPPFKTHGYSDAKGLDVFHLVFHPDFLSSHYQEACSIDGFEIFTEIEPHLRANAGASRFLHLSEEELLGIQYDLKHVENKDKYFRYDNLIPLKQAAALKVLYELSLLMYKQTFNKDESKNSKYEQQILQVLEYIHKNYDKSLTIESLCKEAYMSRSTFLRNFALVTKTTPHQYISQYRKNKAQQLLLNKDFSKNDVAQICGYYDTSHMNSSINRLS